MKTVEIDRTKQLKEQPGTGHNRWHPDIPQVVEAEEGETVVLSTRDALDGQLNPGSTADEIGGVDASLVHPLTGPVYVKGAAPGDLLEMEFLDVVPEPWGFTSILPGMGFLRDLYTEPFLVHWTISGGWATSPQLPGVRLRDGSFMGTSGVAPSHSQVKSWTQREHDLLNRGGTVLVPGADGAVPASGPAAAEGLRTLPPRENGGNFDIKQLTKGAKLLLPVFVDGALFSTGDAHFAQGDGEVCVTAVEMAATAHVRFHVRKGEAEQQGIRGPRFQRDDYFAEPAWAAPRRFAATVGLPIAEDGTNDGENLTLACRNAVLAMIDLLGDRGWSREQAYVICSVAVDLRISNVVDVPNYAVSALLPEDIFVS